MASIRKEIAINANPDDVWDALRDWSALHTRLVPGFVVEARLDGEDRIVTFFTGTEVCERFVSSDDEQRRLVWAINDGSLGLTHYNASAQVFAGDADGTRFVWIVDLLPHELAPTVEQLMERGINTIKATLEPTPVDA